MNIEILRKILNRKSIPVFLALLLLVGNFVVVTHSWSPVLTQKGADEEQWVINAKKSWEEKRGSVIEHTPLFHDMVMPFVAGVFVDSETGYAVWKIGLVFFSQILLFFVLKRVSNLWIALVLTFQFQFLALPWYGPTYTHLAMAFYLLALGILLYRQNLYGLAAGVLLVGSLVRFELAFVLLAFSLLVIAFVRANVQWKSLARQLALPVVLFVGLIYWHGSSVVRFPSEYVFRGNASVVWYIVDYMYYHGYFAKYAGVGRGALTDAIQDSVLVENFGLNKQEMRRASLLEIYRRNPKIISGRNQDWFRQLPANVADLFTVVIPYGDGFQRKTYWWQVLVLGLFASLLSSAAGRLGHRKKEINSTPPEDRTDQGSITSRRWELPVLLVASLACFVPWFVTAPQAHYMIIIAPTFYVAAAMVCSSVANKCADISWRKMKGAFPSLWN